jgi:hypothetical protein
MCARHQSLFVLVQWGALIAEESVGDSVVLSHFDFAVCTLFSKAGGN